MKRSAESPRVLAKRLREVLASRNVAISHKESLDLVASLGGHSDWLSAVNAQVAYSDILLDRQMVLRLCDLVHQRYRVQLHPSGLMTRLRGTAPRRQGSLPIELHQGLIPTYFKRFSEAIGPQYWLDQVQRVKSEAARNPRLRAFLAEQNSVVLNLASASEATQVNNGQLPTALIRNSSLMEGFAFAFQSLGMINAARNVSEKKATELINRIRNAMSQPANIRTMQLEAAVATHFLRRGHRVSFPELSHGSETFDVIVEDLGPQGLELECKLITNDKGRKVHQHESIEFFHQLEPSLALESGRRQSGLAIVITIPGRMPSTESMASMVQGTAAVLASGTDGTLSDGTEVRLIEFPMEILGPLTQPPSAAMKGAIEGVTGTKNREMFVYAPDLSSGLIVCILQSALPDSMLHEVFSTLADAAGRQLTGTRPGAFIVGLHGIASDRLLELARGERTTGLPSALTHHVSLFLDRPEFPHVVGVGFFSKFDYRGNRDSGTAYYFPRRTSPMWDEAYSGIFGPDRGPAIFPPLPALHSN